jgi:hypothetical protein
LLAAVSRKAASQKIESRQRLMIGFLNQIISRLKIARPDFLPHGGKKLTPLGRPNP